MKYYFILLVTFFGISLNACNEAEDPELINEWKLIEQLMDPGDGSGTFQPVTSDKTIEFFADGTVTSNGILCDMSTTSGTGSSGTYSTADSTITPDGCGVSPFVIQYTIEGEHLILSFQCIEACRQKFELVN